MLVEVWGGGDCRGARLHNAVQQVNCIHADSARQVLYLDKERKCIAKKKRFLQKASNRKMMKKRKIAHLFSPLNLERQVKTLERTKPTSSCENVSLCGSRGSTSTGTDWNLKTAIRDFLLQNVSDKKIVDMQVQCHWKQVNFLFKIDMHKRWVYS